MINYFGYVFYTKKNNCHKTKKNLRGCGGGAFHNFVISGYITPGKNLKNAFGIVGLYFEFCMKIFYVEKTQIFRMEFEFVRTFYMKLLM